MTKTPDQIVAECTSWAAEMRRVVEALKHHADGSQEHAQILEGNTALAQLLQEAAECLQGMLDAAPKKSQSKARLEAEVAGLRKIIGERKQSVRDLQAELEGRIKHSATASMCLDPGKQVVPQIDLLQWIDELFHAEQMKMETP